jgi:hypothetical protein
MKQSAGSSAAGLSLMAYQAINGSDSVGVDHYFIAGMINATPLVAVSVTANIMRAYPFTAPYWPAVLDQLALTVATGAAGNARIALYANKEGNGSIYPGALIDGSADISTAVAGLKTFSINRQLVPGRLYWLSHVMSAAITLRGLGVASMFPIRGVDLAASVTGGAAIG